MLDAPAGLVSYLAQFTPDVVTADLLSLVLPGSGTVLRYTNGTVPVSAAASLFPASSPLNGSGGPFSFAVGPRFDRVKIPPRKIGFEGQECPITLYPTQNDLIGNSTWQAYAFAQQLDAAVVEVDRFYWSADGSLTPLGAFIAVYGLLTDIDIGRTTLTLHAKTLPYLLDIPMPRRLYQASCNLVFGGPMCLFNRAAPVVSFACGAGSTATSLTGSGLGTTAAYDNAVCLGLTGANAGQVCLIGAISGGTVSFVSQLYNASFPSAPSPGDTFQLGSAAAITAGTGSNQGGIETAFTSALTYGQGTIIGTSGANNQVTRTISQVNAGVVFVTRNFPFPVAPGDGFTLLPGCPRTTAGCASFANLLHYAGTPYVPPPELSL